MRRARRLVGAAVLAGLVEATAATAGVTRWLAPDGNDRATGADPRSAWRTFRRALPDLGPGDTLILRDGEYAAGTTGLPEIACSGSGRIRSGTADRPITIRAEHERRAHLRADGHGDALTVHGCSFWRIEGLYGSNADARDAAPTDGNVFRVSRARDVELRRLLAVHPNRVCPNKNLPVCNAHAIAIEDSERILVEESEAYDFHRHGISAFRSRDVDLRRCYVAPRADSSEEPTAIIFYGAADSVAENCIVEGSGGINVAGSMLFDGAPGGRRNRLLGVVTLDNRYGSTIRARKFGDGPVLPVADTLVKDSVFARTREVGIYSRGAADTVLDHVTFWGTRGEASVEADEDRGEGAPCAANPDGCSITLRHVLIADGARDGVRVDPAVVRLWAIQDSVAIRVRGAPWPVDAAHVQRVRIVDDGSRGLGDGRCLLWPAADDPHPDAGATILYRYERGSLTRKPLWDPKTGAFPCGAVVAGVNDGERSCATVHRRLNAGANGCAFPAGYR